MITILAVLLLAAPIPASADTAISPDWYLDSVKVEHFTDYYFSPDDVQSLLVDNKDSDTTAHPRGRVYIKMKPGSPAFEPLAEACDKEEQGIPGLPVIYLIDGTVIKDPSPVRILPDYISSVTVVKTTDIPSVSAAKTPMALVLISTSHLHPKPQPGSIIIR